MMDEQKDRRETAEILNMATLRAAEAAYEATLRAGIQNGMQSGNWTVYLTLLGGGAFGNRPGWIIGAIRRALDICRDWPLEVAIVSYGQPDPNVNQLGSGWNQ